MFAGKKINQKKDPSYTTRVFKELFRYEIIRGGYS